MNRLAFTYIPQQAETNTVHMRVHTHLWVNEPVTRLRGIGLPLTSLEAIVPVQMLPVLVTGEVREANTTRGALLPNVE